MELEPIRDLLVKAYDTPIREIAADFNDLMTQLTESAIWVQEQMN